MTTEATRRGHQHPEAFALMQYTSKSSGITEIVWNSRDGVTPFGILMRDGTEGKHVVTLHGFTNTCDCGRDYNMSGDVLAPRSHWGEETGEHWSECM